MPARVKGIQWLIFSTIGVSLVLIVLMASSSSADNAQVLYKYPIRKNTPVASYFPSFTPQAKISAVPSGTPTMIHATLQVDPPTSTVTFTVPFKTLTPNIEGSIYHIVRESDTLATISTLYGITEEELRSINWMHGNAVIPGQRLLVAKGSNWRPQHYGYSIQKGDLLSSYPLSFDFPRFTLHYIPQTYPAVDPEAVGNLFDIGLSNDIRLFGRPLNPHFDVFVTGLFYEIPNQHQRGHSYSKDLYITFLHDGSGDYGDQLYLAAHEMTHLYMWNAFGQPVSFLLSEGAAVYAGKNLTVSSNEISLEQFCKAFQLVGKLPNVSDDELTYFGQNYDLENYYAAGCFVKYLIETYGVEKLGSVYATNNYEDIYDKPLSELEYEWTEYLSSMDIQLPFNPQELVDLNEELELSYHRFFSDIFTRPDMTTPYLLLDQARLAMLDLRFIDARNKLTLFYKAID